jgi:hypothetical protein
VGKLIGEDGGGLGRTDPAAVGVWVSGRRRSVGGAREEEVWRGCRHLGPASAGDQILLEMVHIRGGWRLLRTVAAGCCAHSRGGCLL